MSIILCINFSYNYIWRTVSRFYKVLQNGRKTTSRINFVPDYFLFLIFLSGDVQASDFKEAKYTWKLISHSGFFDSEGKKSR